MTRWKEWLAAAAFSVGMALLVLELLLRYELVTIPVVYESYHFSDEPRHFRDQHTSFGYIPHSTTREMVLHAGLDDVVQEYDVTFRVNNAGLVQRQDIRGTDRYTVVAGDSFAQGVGASPWFYDLEEQFPGWPMANLGIEGTGVSHWVHALDWFDHSAAPVRNVVILFITDDFLRPYWQARMTKDGMAFCEADNCRLVTTYYFPASTEALLEARRRIDAPSSWTIRWLKEQLSAGLSRFRVGEFTIHVRRWYLLQDDHPWFEENKRRFAELAQRYEILFAIHLPQKEEAMAGRWSAQSLTVRRFVEKTGVRTIDGLTRCGLDRDSFHQRDPHPNEKGYQIIRECLAGLLTEQIVRGNKDLLHGKDG